MGVKCQLAVVTVDSAIAGVLCKMLYIYGCCNGSATADVEEYRRRFPVHRIPDLWGFSKVFNTLRECGTLLVFMFHWNEHINNM
jgi:hypothetical protein